MDTDPKGRKRWGAAGPVHDRARSSLYRKIKEKSHGATRECYGPVDHPEKRSAVEQGTASQHQRSARGSTKAAPESTGASPRSTGDLTLGHSAPTTRPPHGAPGSQGGRLRATRRVRSSDGRGLGGGDSGAPPRADATFCRRKDFQPRTDPRPSAPTSPSRREGSSSRRGRNKDPQA